MNGAVPKADFVRGQNKLIGGNHTKKNSYFRDADVGNAAVGPQVGKSLFSPQPSVTREHNYTDTSTVAKDKGHGGSEGHTHEQMSSTKQLPLREQKATGTDSFAIKMHQGYKLHHGGIEGNWSDIAKEAIKTYPNINPAEYDLEDVSKHNAKEGRQKYNLGL
tara:strand:+ start:56 stop:541 length:486 start_codon:yes stop_codon:yes gene_type:complete